MCSAALQGGHFFLQGGVFLGHTLGHFLFHLGQLGRQGVLALLSDSTNVERPGHSDSERMVAAKFDELFNGCDKRIIVATFASNVQRMQLVLKTIDEEIRPQLAADGGDIELVDVDGLRIVVALKGRCAHCRSSEVTIRDLVQRLLREDAIDIAAFPVTAKELGTLIAKVEKKELSNTQAKDVLAAMYGEKLTLEAALKKCGAAGGRLTGEALKAVIEKVFAAEPEAVETIKRGADKKGAKVKFLQGLVMRETRGSADPAEVARTLAEMLQ